jgi:hypothetical protein
MKSLLKIAALICLTLHFGSSAKANAQTSSHKVVGRLTAVGPSYFSAMNGSFALTYTNNQIPTDSKVYLRSGLETSAFVSGELKFQSSWNQLEVTPMDDVAASIWQVERTTQLYSRGGSTHITALDYVFEIHLPSGEISYDKGSDATMGYFKVSVPAVSDPCKPTQSDCELKIDVIK